MERRDAAWLQEMVAQAEGSPALRQGLLTRREEVVAPFPASLRKPEPRRHAAESRAGLGSKRAHDRRGVH
jgi:hypothetical protein